MADTPLLIDRDVEAALVRPLTDPEREFIDDLIDQASSKLRARMRSVDARIAAFDPDSDAGLDPRLVASVLADVIARRLINPKRLWSSGGEGMGPYTSASETFPGARGGSAVEGFGNLTVTDADLAQLATASAWSAPGTIRTRARFCP